MKSINNLKKEGAIILIILAIIIIGSLCSNEWTIFTLSLFAFIIIKTIYEIRIKLTEDKIKHENYENLKRIRELEEKQEKQK